MERDTFTSLHSSGCPQVKHLHRRASVKRAGVAVDGVCTSAATLTVIPAHYVITALNYT